MNTHVPVPVLLNCWKHHLHFIKEKISEYKTPGAPQKLKDELKKIGESTTDLYTGNISPAEAALISINILKKADHFTFIKYKNWITKSKKGYQNEIFPDDSTWVFRKGIDENRYIHIHPGRYVPFTMRVKAVSLKIAICAMVEPDKLPDPMNLEFINAVRKKYLGLEPVKSLDPGSGLMKILSLLNSH